MNALFSFFLLFACFFMGIEIFRSLTGKQKWQAVKTISYSLMCTLLAVIVLVIVVVLF